MDSPEKLRPLRESPPLREKTQMRLEWVGVPSGTFIMGDLFAGSANAVTLSSPYWILNEPVTQFLWTSMTKGNPSEFRSHSLLPVESISYYDALDFCQILNRACQPVEGWHITLPTEAQWEYACRAGTSTHYYWGNEWIPDRANADNRSDSTTRVDTYPLNPLGLYDTHGNVWEWCLDHFENGHAIRGGAWNSARQECRSAFRMGKSPDFKANNIGFRPVITRITA